MIIGEQHALVRDRAVTRIHQAVARDEAGRPRDDPRTGLLGDRGIGIPDSPAVDRAALQRRLPVRRRKEDELDAIERLVMQFERSQHQIMADRALGRGDLAARKVGDRADRRIPTHHHHGPDPLRFDRTDRLDRGARPDREDKGRIPAGTGIDRPGVKRFQQRPGIGKGRPFNPVREVCEAVRRLHHNLRSAALIADEQRIARTGRSAAMARGHQAGRAEPEQVAPGQRKRRASFEQHAPHPKLTRASRLPPAAAHDNLAFPIGATATLIAARGSYQRRQ